MNDLIDIKNFRPLVDFKNFDLNIKGLYALRVKDVSILPNLFKNELVSLDTTLIYIGKGERTIRQRLLEECQGKGHGTFFRGIGALLNFKPERGSLIKMKNKNNYCFSNINRDKIVEWMNVNLDLNFIRIDSNIEQIEKQLIQLHSPILNSTHNSKKSQALAALRKSCREYALLR